MAYGDYYGPDKANKGHEGGACNRSSCQAGPALFWNHGSRSWYCADCARDIGDDVVNARHWPADFARMFPDRKLHPMFETREQMDARKARCSLGVGCDETGFCYADANDEPDQCGREARS